MGFGVPITRQASFTVSPSSAVQSASSSSNSGAPARTQRCQALHEGGKVCIPLGSTLVGFPSPYQLPQICRCGYYPTSQPSQGRGGVGHWGGAVKEIQIQTPPHTHLTGVQGCPKLGPTLFPVPGVSPAEHSLRLLVHHCQGSPPRVDPPSRKVSWPPNQPKPSPTLRRLTPHGQSQALLDATDLLHPRALDDSCACLQQVFAHGVFTLVPHLKGTVIPLHLVIQVDAAQLWMGAGVSRGRT